MAMTGRSWRQPQSRCWGACRPAGPFRMWQDHAAAIDRGVRASEPWRGSSAGAHRRRAGRWLPPERRRGMVFQDYALFPHLTAWQNARFGLRRSRRQSRQLVADLMGLADLHGRFPISCPAANASGLPWLELWPLHRVSFCWMNRFPTWMLKSVCACAANWPPCFRSVGRLG